MDYQQFYNEVVAWINEANQQASQHGLSSEVFWQWVTDSTAAMCNRYNNNQLVVKQMMMLSRWLEEAYMNSR